MAPRHIIIGNHFFAKSAEAYWLVLFIGNNLSQSSRQY